MVNGKYYIGSTSMYERRIWQHKNDLKKGVHKNPKLQASWNKHGEDAFIFEILEYVDAGAELKIEDIYLAQHVGKPECYNINTGAESPRTGVLHTEAAKQKTSANRKGKHAGENHYRYGQTVSEEVRKKIGDAQRGVKKEPRVYTAEGLAKLKAAARRGKDSHFYGKRPSNADDLQKAIRAVKPTGEVEVFKSLSIMRDTFGVSIATIIRACVSKKPISKGAISGWILSYDGEEIPNTEAPEEYKNLPRSRLAAKQLGSREYFTGEPCKRGHIAPRKLKGACVCCLKEDWNAENKKRSEEKKMVKENKNTKAFYRAQEKIVKDKISKLCDKHGWSVREAKMHCPDGDAAGIDLYVVPKNRDQNPITGMELAELIIVCAKKKNFPCPYLDGSHPHDTGFLVELTSF